eukprot:2370160-Amphidinium_carterae.1
MLSYQISWLTVLRLPFLCQANNCTHVQKCHQCPNTRPSIRSRAPHFLKGQGVAKECNIHSSSI